MNLPALVLGYFILCISFPTHALMAGLIPDSPDMRVDANTANSPWAGVGSLSINDSTFGAVVIAPQYVLTAAHVVAGKAKSPGDITFNLNMTGSLSHQIRAEKIFINPDYRGFAKGKVALHDLAVVKLSSPLPSEVPIYPLNRERVVAGTIMTLVGYGASGHGYGGAMVPRDPAVKRTGQNIADRIIEQKAFVYDFDGPDFTTSIMGGGTLGNGIETTVASGDSGSPVFMWQNNQWVLVGISTYQASVKVGAAAPSFGSLGGGILIAAYINWIKDIISGSLAY